MEGGNCNQTSQTVRTLVLLLSSLALFPWAIVKVGVMCLIRDPTTKAHCGWLGLRRYRSDYCSSDTQGCGASHVVASIKPAQLAS